MLWWAHVERAVPIEEGRPLLFFDPQTRELLRTRPNPLQPGEAALLQRGRPPGPVPRPSTEPITVQRRAWASASAALRSSARVTRA